MKNLLCLLVIVCALLGGVSALSADDSGGEGGGGSDAWYCQDHSAAATWCLDRPTCFCTGYAGSPHGPYGTYMGYTVWGFCPIGCEEIEYEYNINDACHFASANSNHPLRLKACQEGCVSAGSTSIIPPFISQNGNCCTVTTIRSCVPASNGGG